MVLGPVTKQTSDSILASHLETDNLVSYPAPIPARLFPGPAINTDTLRGTVYTRRILHHESRYSEPLNKGVAKTTKIALL